MKLEDQVVSLELAKKLKELGVKQQSIFWHYRYSEIGWVIDHISMHGTEQEEEISAFTVAELGEMLPDGFRTERYCDEWQALDDADEGEEYRTEHALTEADARAKMLIHLIEKGIVKP